jgi:hypothetical protein
MSEKRCLRRVRRRKLRCVYHFESLFELMLAAFDDIS